MLPRFVLRLGCGGRGRSVVRLVPSIEFKQRRLVPSIELNQRKKPTVLVARTKPVSSAFLIARQTPLQRPRLLVPGARHR